MKPAITLYNKIATLLCAAAIIPLSTSCLNEISSGIEPDKNVSMDTRSLTTDMKNNATLYVFRDNSATNHPFVGKQLNVTKTEKGMTTHIPVGTWHLGIITSDGFDITADPQFKVPPTGTGNMQSPMWQTATTTQSAGTFLSQTPEILYVPVNKVVIDANKTTTVTADEARLLRNVAKIEFILQEHVGFTIGEGQDENAYIDLFNVPTTLSWEGKYLPSRDDPEVAMEGEELIPIREYLNFTPDDKGVLVADTVSFIIPAHRHDLVNNSDKSTHKLKFRIAMPIAGEPFFGQSEGMIELDSSPIANSIIRVFITKFSGEPDTNVDIKVEVMKWHGTVEQEVNF